MSSPRLPLYQRIALWSLYTSFFGRPLCDIPLVGNRLLKIAFWAAMR